MKDWTPEDEMYLRRTLDRAGVKHQRDSRERDMRLAANAHAVVGLPLLTGPDIVSGVLGLPDGSPKYVATAGAVLLIRAILMHAIIRKERS